MGNFTKAVNSFYHTCALFDKIHCCCSHSAKLPRHLQQIATKLEIEIKKIRKVFDVRLVASSRRALNAPAHNDAALYQHFKQRSESKFLKTHNRAMYTGMIRKMLTVRFVEYLVLVNTCLAELPELLKTYIKAT